MVMTSPTTRLPSVGGAIELDEQQTTPSPLGYDSAVATGTDSEHEASDARPLLRTSDEEKEDEDDNQSINDALLTDKSYDQQDLPGRLSRWKKSYTRWPLLATMGLMVAASVIIAVLIFSRPHSKTLKHKPQKLGVHWKGYSNIENVFAFGDSWTSTHFRVSEEQPNTNNPLGNPPFPGSTSSNGVNYIGYLVTKYNQSFLKAYDFAFGGSVIDSGLDPTLLEWLDFPHQIESSFKAGYVNNETGIPTPTNWTPENSLFSTFFGINDVITYDRNSHLIGEVFARYERLIGDLYSLSARNFLVINIPPTDLSPSVTSSQTPEDQADFRADVEEFNGLIKNLVRHLRRQYKDITIFEYDVHDLFQRVIANPRSVHQTRNYKDTATYCSEYDRFELGRVPTPEQIKKCRGLRVNDYLWLNSLHVTEPVHEAMAAEIEELLTSTL